jgi:hypothetical protein
MAFVGSLSGSGGASNTINVTGSMIIANPGTGGLFPAFPGTDTVFFVSGAIDGKAAGSRTVSVFGGDTVVSGSLTIGTGSIRIDSNEIRFQGGAAKITSGSGGLTFFDSGNSGGVTLASLAAGAGGGDVDGPTSATDNAIARFDLTTGKIIQNSDLTVSDLAGGAGGTVNLDTDSAATVNLFTTNATSVVIGKSGGSTVTTNGNIKVGSNIIQAADGATALTLTSTSGNVAVAGELTVTGNNIKSSTGATAITLSGGNVIIPGDLTVQGTTVTVDATTVSIEDPVIGFGFTSGSATRVAPGDRGFIGGLDGENNVAMIWDESANGFGVFRTTSSTTSSLPVDVVDYSTFRAGKLELGGATAFITSSDGNLLSAVAGSSLLLNAAAGPPGSNGNVVFEVAGTDYLQVSGSGGNTIEIKSPGGLVNSASIFASNVGLISFAGATTNLTMGANSDAATTTIRTGNILGIRSTQNLFNTTATTVNFAGGASTALIMGNSAGSNQISGQTIFNQGLSGSLTKLSDGTSYLIAGTNVTITTGSSGAVTIASTGTTTNAAGSNTQVQFNDGGTAFGADADFTFTTSTNTLAVPNASVTAVTASSVIAGGATVDLFNTTATTVNFAGAATTLTIGDITTATTTVRGGTLVGNTTTQAVFNTTATTVNAFGAATSINVGAADGTLTSNVSIVPGATNSYDLGTPSLRWRNMYTGDLHLKNERGDWTVIEEEEFLTLTNNKSGKRYKFVLEEI